MRKYCDKADACQSGQTLSTHRDWVRDHLKFSLVLGISILTLNFDRPEFHITTRFTKRSRQRSIFDCISGRSAFGTDQFGVEFRDVKLSLFAAVCL
jgi:hypothetical protein